MLRAGVRRRWALVLRERLRAVGGVRLAADERLAFNMQYPTFPMPDSYGDFPNHSEMAAYLDACAEAFGLPWVQANRRP